MDEVDRAGGAAGEPRARLAHHRVEAVDERDRGHDAGARGELDELGCRRRGGGERLLADHVLAGFDRAPRQVGMQVVGRADVDDVDGRIDRERLGAVEHAGDVERRGGRARAGGVSPRDAGDLGAGPPRSADVDRTDEADSGDRGAQSIRHAQDDTLAICA